jgi:hypothetical protein
MHHRIGLAQTLEARLDWHPLPTPKTDELKAFEKALVRAEAQDAVTRATLNSMLESPGVTPSTPETSSGLPAIATEAIPIPIPAQSQTQSQGQQGHGQGLSHSTSIHMSNPVSVLSQSTSTFDTSSSGNTLVSLPHSSTLSHSLFHSQSSSQHQSHHLHAQSHTTSLSQSLPHSHSLTHSQPPPELKERNQERERKSAEERKALMAALALADAPLPCRTVRSFCAWKAKDESPTGAGGLGAVGVPGLSGGSGSSLGQH